MNLINKIFNRKIAGDTSNIVLPDATGIDNGIEYKSAVNSNVPNGLFNHISDAIQYLQFSVGLYSNTAQYTEGNICKVITKENILHVGSRYRIRIFRRNGNNPNSTTANPPIPTTPTTTNGIACYPVENETEWNTDWDEIRTANLQHTVKLKQLLFGELQEASFDDAVNWIKNGNLDTTKLPVEEFNKLWEALSNDIDCKFYQHKILGVELREAQNNDDNKNYRIISFILETIIYRYSLNIALSDDGNYIASGVTLMYNDKDVMINTLFNMVGNAYNITFEVYNDIVLSCPNISNVATYSWTFDIARYTSKKVIGFYIMRRSNSLGIGSAGTDMGFGWYRVLMLPLSTIAIEMRGEKNSYYTIVRNNINKGYNSWYDPNTTAKLVNEATNGNKYQGDFTAYYGTEMVINNQNLFFLGDSLTIEWKCSSSLDTGDGRSPRVVYNSLPADKVISAGGNVEVDLILMCVAPPSASI